MALESLLWVPRHFWGYVECFLEFKESIGMLLEAFWKLSDAFFEASKKSVLNLEISGNFYLRAVLRHEEASKPPKTVLHAQSALKLFWGVSSTQNEPETYLQHHHTTKIDLCRLTWRFEILPPTSNVNVNFRFWTQRNPEDTLPSRIKSLKNNWTMDGLDLVIYCCLKQWPTY